MAHQYANPALSNTNKSSRPPPSRRGSLAFDVWLPPRALPITRDESDARTLAIAVARGGGSVGGDAVRSRVRLRRAPVDPLFGVRAIDERAIATAEELDVAQRALHAVNLSKATRGAARIATMEAPSHLGLCA